MGLVGLGVRTRVCESEAVFPQEYVVKCCCFSALFWCCSAHAESTAESAAHDHRSLQFRILSSRLPETFTVCGFMWFLLERLLTKWTL